MREEVRRLAAWAPVPAEAEWTDEQSIEAFVQAIDAVAKPLAADEIDSVLALLDRPYEDSVYGVLNLVVALLESAPSTGWEMGLPTEDRPWFDLLRSRWINYLDAQP